MADEFNPSVPKILLIGNGINKAFGKSSWEDIMNSLSKGEYGYDKNIADQIKKLPYALQTIAISKDTVSGAMKKLSEKLMPQDLVPEHANLLNSLSSLPFDAILTSNYSYEIEKSLNPDFDLSAGHVSKFRKRTRKGNTPQEQFGLFKYIEVSGKQIWHIHGEAAHYNSMVMGHYYYGKLLGEIQKRVSEVIRSYAVSLKTGKPYTYKSWVDYFLLSDVYIVGFGLNPSEMDIWWLINAKKRHFSDCGQVFFYEPNLDRDEKVAIRALAEVFGIRCTTEQIYEDSQYVNYYNTVVKVIEDSIIDQACR